MSDSFDSSRLARVLGVRPGAAFHVVNLGCKVNRVESDSITAALLAHGCALTRLEDAEVVVVNTCTVTGEADKKARKAVRRALSKAGKASVIVTGCGAAIDPDAFASLGERVAVVSRGELTGALSSDGSRSGSPFRVGPAFRTRVFLKAQDGCDRACTYCIVHTARGPARSTPLPSLVDDARRYFAAGVKEVVLVGIDLGSYRDEGVLLDGLVSRLLALADEYPGEDGRPARVRASSLEPHTVSPAFVELLASLEGRLCRHVHLPLQSGSSKVLSEMARPYTAEAFVDFVGEVRRQVPGLSLTTDVICGFPGETDADFEETLAVVRQCRFSKVHVFPYSRRDGTPAAARPDQVEASLKAERAARLRLLADELRTADLASRAHTTELALVEGATMLTESYHELPAPPDVIPGSLVPVVIAQERPSAAVAAGMPRAGLPATP